jgi:hypothetical protein
MRKIVFMMSVSPAGGTTRLRLAETRAFGNGVVMLRYERPAP